MRFWDGKMVVHLESMHLIKLYDLKNWLKRMLDEKPDERENWLYKIQLVNKEINKRDLLPMTAYQKRIVTGPYNGKT